MSEEDKMPSFVNEQLAFDEWITLDFGRFRVNELDEDTLIPC